MCVCFYFIVNECEQSGCALKLFFGGVVMGTGQRAYFEQNIFLNVIIEGEPKLSLCYLSKNA